MSENLDGEVRRHKPTWRAFEESVEEWRHKRRGCPLDEKLAAYFARTLPLRHRLAVRWHVQRCALCRADLFALREASVPLEDAYPSAGSRTPQWGWSALGALAQWVKAVGQTLQVEGAVAILLVGMLIGQYALVFHYERKVGAAIGAMERRVQRELRTGVRAAIDEGFRRNERLLMLLAQTPAGEEVITAARQIRVVAIPVDGKAYPYPTLGREPLDVVAIGKGLHRFPHLQAEYREYLRQWADILRKLADILPQTGRFELGDILIQTGQLDGAILVLEYLRQVRPDDKSLLFSLGELYKMRGDHCQAIAVYQAMIDQGMQDPRPWHYAGWSFFELHEYDRALEYYNRATDILPTYAKVFYNKALAYEAKGGLSAEERARLVDGNLQRAIDLTLAAYQREGDNNPRIPFTLSILYTSLQKPAVALQHLERSIQRDRAYIVRAEKEYAFGFFRDPAHEPYHTEFLALLDRYRPGAFDPSTFIE